MTGTIFQKKMFISLVDWKKSLILRTIQAHNSWINSLCFLPTKFNEKEVLCLVSGGADEKICLWNSLSGKLLSENDERNRIVMHGMKLFVYEKNNQKNFYLVSASYEKIQHEIIIQSFKIWTK